MLVVRGLSFLSLLSAVVASAHGASHQWAHGAHKRTAGNTNTTSQTGVDYDYVVVGSGPGGGPLAARLAIAGHKVLLLDAGDDQTDAVIQQVPALQLQSTEYEGQKWDYFVNHYQDLSRQEQDSKMTYKAPSGDLHVGPNPPANSEPLGILYPRAGTLGGCSTHNAMITIYPFEKDWQDIASITGNNTWSPGLMRKYFERLERNRYLPGGSDGHGYDGWLTTSLTNLELVIKDPKLLSLIVSAATGAGKSLLGKVLNTVSGLGGVLLRDLNSNAEGRDEQTGPYQVPLAVDLPEYRRTGPFDFIKDTANAVNSDGSRKYHLDLQLNTLVTNVRFDNSGSKPRATGVDYLEGQSLYRADPRSGNATASSSGSAKASREVILAAGSFNTPQLLKLSGVGPKQELNKWGIDPLVDLPGVGNNLQDRYETTVVGESPTDFVLTEECTFMYKNPDPCLEQWKNGQDKGTYTTNGIAIAATRNSTTSDGDPDLLVSGAPVYFTGYYPNYSYEGLKESNHWAWITLKARGRNNAGTVELRSKDPRDTPVINFNSFDTGVTEDGADEKDLQAMVDGMKYSRRVFDDVIPLDQGFNEVWPGRNVSTDDELKEFIKKEAWGHHACCTAPIGADDDPNAVLDSDFRVRGTDGLRVVDASIFPKIPGYYIALPIYMVSEKAAEVIIADAA